MVNIFVKSAILVMMTVLMTFVMLAGVALLFTRMKVDTWFSLPILTILGVTLLLSTLSIVSMAYGSFGLTDKSQALALPEGSIRAVIALSLIVIFAILSVFLFGSLLEGSTQVLNNLPSSFEVVQFLKDHPTARDVVDSVDASGKSHTVTFRLPADLPGVDFAKQLLVLIGTLMTAVSSFYFGSKTATSAAAQAAGGSQLPLTPQSINPTVHSRADGNLELTITGQNLNPVTSVRIMNGATPITATGVSSNYNSVQCTIPIDGTTPLGPWDVVVADTNDQTATLHSALTIT